MSKLIDVNVLGDIVWTMTAGGFLRGYVVCTNGTLAELPAENVAKELSSE